MRTRRPFALATAAALAGCTLAAAPAAAEDEGATETELLNTEFSSGELAEWWDNDAAERIDFPEVDGETVLAVDRAQDHQGIQSPHGLLADEGLEVVPGDTVVYTAEIRLSNEVEDTADARWVAHDDGAGHNYQWGQATEVSAEDWTEVTSSFEITEETDLEAFRAYTGLPDVNGLEDYTYYIRSASLILQHTGEADPGNGDEGDGEEDIADSPEALSHDFEDGELGPWGPRYVSEEQHTVEVTDAAAHQGTYSAAVTDRTHQGQGIGAEAGEALAAGQQYDLSAWVKFAEGEETDNIWLSAASTADGSTSYSTLGQFSGLSDTEWVQIEQRFTAPSADELQIYFETTWDNDNPGVTSNFYIDSIQITRVEDDYDSDLTPLKDTVGFPLGVAIDERETTGTAAQVVNHHFDRITAENHMKPEAWYSGEGLDTFGMHPQAEAILDYAAANDLGVYGHVLVWHSQTPAWFFEVSSQAEMDERMEFHIRSVAEAIYEQYGAFGSETNPVVAWDVVNEVIDDGSSYEDGMRRSNWYQAWGDESYVDAAFEYAEHYFNGVYADPNVDRPVALYINDYNTELSAKRSRMIALTERLVERGAPVDGFAHQFHLNLSMPIENLRQAFQDVEAALPGMPQLVTELDITVGDSVTEGALIDQAYHYRDAFALFREWSAENQLDAVAVWGLNDGRSWRSAQAPLIFNDDFSPKLAYTGIVGGELPPRENRAVVFAHNDETAAADPENYWTQLPLHTTEEGVAEFQLRWSEDGLVFYVESAADSVTVEHEGQTYQLSPEGESLAEIEGLSQGDSLAVDLHADGDSWLNATLTLVEPLSYHQAPEAEQAPELNAELTDAWADATTLTTGVEIETGPRQGATAEVYTLWEGETLHLLADVTDPDVDVSASDPWVQDSVEFFLDLGNHRNGPYRTASRDGHHLLSEQYDFQFRISAENEVSVGSGDEQFQLEQLQSATSTTEDGYIVQAAISLREYGGAGSIHGFDVQVNDSHEGSRLVTTWADPTGNGYQDTERWGTLRLVTETGDDPTDPGEEIWPPDPEELSEDNRGQVEILTDPAVEGEDIEAFIGEDNADQEVRTWLFSDPADLGSATADADAVITVTLPADSAGDHRFAVYTPEGELLGWTEITIVAADDDAAPSPTPTEQPTESPAPDEDEDGLAITGATIGALLLGALILLGAGTLILRTSRRCTQEEVD
ncbi:endo-1,4-beta-xylanase [Nesterenkonia ebinurensis]|uniref:endo-1,4-beta-xylanase n=1 Tax=Nesterenkonia ebinurensis TaxID=2608252 RepID=UPI00168A94B1|nr:endo-1,4-beta-xylanase [Nesterenkonia ebinurensis]